MKVLSKVLIVESTTALQCDVKTTGHERTPECVIEPGKVALGLEGAFARVLSVADGGSAVVTLSLPEGTEKPVTVEVWRDGETIDMKRVRPALLLQEAEYDEETEELISHEVYDKVPSITIELADRVKLSVQSS